MTADVEDTDVDVYGDSLSLTTFGNVHKQFTGTANKTHRKECEWRGKGSGGKLHFGGDEVVEFDEEQRGDEGNARQRDRSTSIRRLGQIFGNLPVDIEPNQ